MVGTSLASTKRNKIHIEFLRIICIYLVMFNHTGTNGFFLFSVAEYSKLYWFYMFISIACKVAVPIFFMISGALLLGKNESIQDIYQKRIFKYVIVLVGTSFLYQVYRHYFQGTDIGFVIGLKQIYSSNASVALWYLYSHIGVLIMLPLMRKMVRSMDNKDYVYIAVSSLIITGIIPIIQYYCSKGTLWLNDSFSASLITASNIMYVIMGYYFENILEEKYYNRKTVIALIGVSLLCIILCCFMTQYKADITGELSEGKSQAFHNSLIAVPAFTLYFCSKFFFMKVKANKKILWLIQLGGGTTFGIYLAEGILRERLLFVFIYLKPFLHILPACLIYIFVALIVGALIVAVLKKIPLLKEYI